MSGPFPLSLLRADGAAHGQVLAFDAGLNEWRPADVAGGGSSANLRREVLQPTGNGQTTFTLAETPADPSIFALSVNGQEQIPDVDFTVQGTTLTWISPDFDLATSDVLIARYTV